MALFQINPRHTMPDEMLAGFMSMPMLQEGFQNSHSFEMRRWSKIKNGFTHFQNGDIVIAKITPCFQNRKSAIISGLPNDCGAGSTELHVLRDVTGLLFMPFFLWIFKTHLFIEDGKKHFTGTAGQQRIGKDFISTYLIPLPSLFEQERIVAKIEELLPHIEEYDRVEQKLDKLNTEFPEQLKKSILQWAIQGKLLPQNPDDEPASVLLDRIRAEKAKLVKAGKIKKDKVESVIFRRDNSHYEKLDGMERCIDDELPFEIPESWAWVRWGAIAESIQYGYNAPAKQEGRIRMVRISDIHENTVAWSSVPFCDIDDSDIPTYLLQANDILFARTGGTVGKSFLVSEVPCESIYAGYLIRTRYSSLLCPQYLKYFMESPLYWQQLKSGTTATAQPNCNGQTLAKMLLPLPPANEQLRIVDNLTRTFAIIERM